MYEDLERIVMKQASELVIDCVCGHRSFVLIRRLMDPINPINSTSPPPHTHPILTHNTLPKIQQVRATNQKRFRIGFATTLLGTVWVVSTFGPEIRCVFVYVGVYVGVLRRCIASVDVCVY